MCFTQLQAFKPCLKNSLQKPLSAHHCRASVVPLSLALDWILHRIGNDGKVWCQRLARKVPTSFTGYTIPG